MDTTHEARYAPRRVTRPRPNPAADTAAVVRLLRDGLSRALRAAGVVARRMYEDMMERRRARALYDTLRVLDDRTLRDLGVDRSEIMSLATEVTQDARRPRAPAGGGDWTFHTHRISRNRS